MLVTLQGRASDSSDLQRRNASEPMCVTLEGRWRELRLKQSLNALPLIVVNDSGSEMEVSSEHPENAYEQMVLTVSGSVREVRGEPRNDLFPIVLTPSGKAPEKLKPRASCFTISHPNADCCWAAVIILITYMY